MKIILAIFLTLLLAETTFAEQTQTEKPEWFGFPFPNLGPKFKFPWPGAGAPSSSKLPPFPFPHPGAGAPSSGPPFPFPRPKFPILPFPGAGAPSSGPSFSFPRPKFPIFPFPGAGAPSSGPSFSFPRFKFPIFPFPGAPSTPPANDETEGLKDLEQLFKNENVHFSAELCSSLEKIENAFIQALVKAECTSAAAHTNNV